MFFDSAQQQAIEEARAFAREHFTEGAIQRWCDGQGMPTPVLDAYYRSDLGRLSLPESMGGIPSSCLTHVLILEELHRAAGATLTLLSQTLSLSLLKALDGGYDHEAVRSMFGNMGRIVFSEAITEAGSGTDTYMIESTVVEEDGEFVLHGSKMFVTNGQYAPYILTVAREQDSTPEDQRLSFWLFPRELSGISTCPVETIGQSMAPLAAIDFNHVKMKPEYAIGERGKAFSVLMKEFDIGRILICASALGLAEAAMDDAAHYVTRRTSFGETLSQLPQIQEKLTDMEVKIRCMKALVYQAARDNDLKGDSRLSAALMKRMVPKAATEVASDALQLFGGLGYTKHSRVSRIWQDCRGCQIAQGTDEIMVKIAGKRIIADYAAHRAELFKKSTTRC